MRRYSQIKPSRGTVIPASLRAEVIAADRGCVGAKAGMLGHCTGGIQLDHVRASHGMGMKSESSRGNLLSLCNTHHLVKTLNGRKWRPILLAYIAERDR